MVSSRKKIRRVVLAFALLCVFGHACGISAYEDDGKTSVDGARRPNIVFILTDDMRADDVRYVPETKRLIGDRGLVFENAFVTTPECCPSRATFLTGKYAHNHGVRSNFGEGGGFEGFRAKGEDESIGLKLQNAGYETFFGGKYLNGYDETTYVPPGWDEWHGRWPTEWNVNGEIIPDSEYGGPYPNTPDKILGEKAARFIRDRGGSEGGAPFFAMLSARSPHGDPGDIYRISPEAEGLYEDAEAPRSGAFNEQDVSDKPEWVRDRDLLSEEEIAAVDEKHRSRARTLYSVDTMVKDVVSALKETGELRDTYIFFTSDHGFKLGQHRLVGKLTAYEDDIRVPLMVRGPGVEQGERGQIIINNDFAPTFLDLGVPGPLGAVAKEMDGTSMVPLFGEAGKLRWRSRFLIDGPLNGESPAGEFYAMRGKNLLWVQYPPGASQRREFYRLDRDPDQSTSRDDTLSEERRYRLNSLIGPLRTCEGRECRAAEGYPRDG